MTPAHACSTLIFLVTVCDDGEGALAEVRRGIDLDPLSEFTNSGSAWVALFAREYEYAAAEAARTLEMFPYSLQAEYVLGLSDIRLGNLDRAIAAPDIALIHHFGA